MPIYDFRCLECHHKFAVSLSYSEYDHHETACPQCQSRRIERIIRKVRITRGDRGRLASMAEDSNLSALDNDPRTLGRMMREMKNEIGATDLPGEFDEVVDRLEKGQSPEDIERDLPDLGGDPGSLEP
ncbi:MAG: zinc ribbon domain-containing protein [Anaerolineaceae bacterium]|nr:zinc ribbon domain-containing protein [Anaerolineaceae bacterium]